MKMTNEEWRRFYLEEMTYEDSETGCWIWMGELGGNGYPTWVTGRGAKINLRQWLWGPLETDRPESIAAVEGGTLEAYPVYFNTRQCGNWRRCLRRDHLRIERWGRRHVVSSERPAEP
jgi:hypothetical protein